MSARSYALHSVCTQLFFFPLGNRPRIRQAQYDLWSCVQLIELIIITHLQPNQDIYTRPLYVHYTNHTLVTT